MCLELHLTLKCYAKSHKPQGIGGGHLEGGGDPIRHVLHGFRHCGGGEYYEVRHGWRALCIV